LVLHLENSYKIYVKLVLFEEIDPARVKIYFVLVLDCHEHSDTGTAVPPVAALL